MEPKIGMPQPKKKSTTTFRTMRIRIGGTLRLGKFAADRGPAKRSPVRRSR